MSVSHWKPGQKQRIKNHSNRMSARHLKKGRKESRCPQDIHRAGMLCGCFFLEKRRAEETCLVRKGDGRIGTGTCLCLLLCRRGKDQSTAVLPEDLRTGICADLSAVQLFPFLDDGDAEDMQAMRRMSHQILRRCRMVVVCGKETTGTMNTEISMADRLHIICTTLDGLSKIKENE